MKGNVKKIGIFGNSDFALANYRSGLIKSLIKDGWEVLAIAPETNSDFISIIEKTGARFLSLPLKRTVAPFSDLVYFFKVWKICRREKFFVCHNFSAKPNILAGLAERMSGISKIFFTVTGLGYLYSASGWKVKLMRFLTEKLLRFSFAGGRGIFFQNKNDLRIFSEKKIVDPKRAILVSGSGVDIDYFSPSSIKKGNFHQDKTIVLMVSRLLRSKGVLEFLAAADFLKSENFNIEFWLAGIKDEKNPEGLSEIELDSALKKSNVVYLGERRDVREILNKSDIFVFPSYYAEGVPRAILEAMAMTKAIIASNIPGNKEAIIDGENGILIEPKSVEAIVSAIKYLSINPLEREKLGKRARKTAEEFFSEKSVIEKTLMAYNLQ